MSPIKLVLLPGLDGTGVLFEPLLRALPSDFDPVVIAYPDHQKLGYEALLPYVLERLPRDEPFVLLGESFGGPLSLRVAETRPTGMRALILSASFISCPYAFVPRWVAHLVRDLPFRALPHYAGVKALFGRYATPELAALSARTLSQVSPAVFAARMREAIRVNVAAELAACAYPMLYLQGTQDLVVPGGNLSRILSIRPDVDFVRLKSPHMVLQTQPAAAAQAITAFVNKVLREPSVQ